MRFKFLFLALIAFIAVPGFGQMKVKSKAYDNMLHDLLSHTVREIAVADIDDNDQDIVFLDAREKSEYEVSHIKNAIWIGYDDFKLSRVKAVKKIDKIIVYCSVGYRSEKVGEKLISAGYKNLYNLYGSIFEWVNQDRPVYNMEGDRTYKVHAFDQEWGRWLKKGEKVYQ